MLYDLNVPWTPTTPPHELQRILSFLSSLGYSTFALNHVLSLPLPSSIKNPICLPAAPQETHLLTRATITVTDPTQNHRLRELSTAYQIVALRPTNLPSLERACLSYDTYSILSLDLSQHFPFHFKRKTLMAAINRGIRVELSYAQCTSGDSNARRNFISNVLQIVRATKGRGLIVSSEAKSVLGVRAPADVGNLLGVWGLGRERAVEAIGVNSRAVVVNEGLKRSSFRGVVDVIDGGEAYVPAEKDNALATSAGNPVGTSGNGKGKRKAEDADEAPKISNREKKRLKAAARKAEKEASSQAQAHGKSAIVSNTPREPETPSTTNIKANG